MPEALPTTWTSHAACQSATDEEWFPTKGDRASIRNCKRICHRCLVRPECLAWAVKNYEREGIWGGFHAITEIPLVIRKFNLNRKDSFENLADTVRPSMEQERWKRLHKEKFSLIVSR